MKYVYQARSKEGRLETGTVEASSKESAALLLQKYNIYVTSIKEQTPLIFRTENIAFLNRVSKKDLAIFSRQLSMMLQSRVSVSLALKSLAVQTKNPDFKQKILKSAQLVEEGNSLSEAFSAFPEIFSIFYISLIKTGEASGKISDALMFLSDHFEREHDISSQIKGAMIYPILVIVVLVAVMFLVMFFVMPKLVELLQQTQSNPPMFTQLMINLYGFLGDYWWIILTGFVLLIGFIIYYFTTKEGRKKFDELSLKAPIIGEFLKKIYLVRFAENVSTLINAGLSINNALRITKDTVENYVYKKIIGETEQKVSEGERMSSVLVGHPQYIPAFVVQVIQVGEDTGKLDTNLMEIVNFYQKEIKRAVETFTELLEPMLIVFLGAVVSLMAISVIQPLYGVLGTI